MRTTLPSTDELQRLVGQLEEAVARGIDGTKTWLASEQGQRSRAMAAQALVLAAPVLMRHPFFKTPLGRLVGAAGAVALVKEVADLIRDWEPAVTES